jgi:hypothetical protein
MIIYLLLLIPILITFSFWYFYKEKFVWWELLLPFGVTLILIVVSKIIIDKKNVTFIEFWGSNIKQIEYYESWDEYIHEICSRTETDANGQTTTHFYDCSYVSYHPPEWIAITTINESLNISEQKYHEILKFWNVKERFIELDRNYYSDDGDKYLAIWDKKDNSAIPITTVHKYENKVKASDLTIFNIKLNEIDSLYLFRYPLFIDEFTYPTILGCYPHDTIVKKLNRLNGKFGPSNEMRLFILVFKNKPVNIAFNQENFWVGGNMNEFVICIGIDNKYNIIWSHVFSWTLSEDLKIQTRNYVSELKYLSNTSLDRLYYYLNTNLKNFKRRSFNEFDYLTIEPSTLSVIIVFIISFVVSICVNMFSIKNEI